MTDAERDAIRGFILGEVSREVRRSIGAIDAETLRGPAGQDGKDGDPGERGEKGDRGDNGLDGLLGADGKDGVGLQGEKGIDGAPGKDADPEVIQAEVAAAVALIPAPKDGAPGKDADPEMIRAEVAKAVAAFPSPAPGKDGEDGKDVDLLVVKALVAGEVAHAVAATPPPKDGRDGKDGITVEQLETATLKALGAALGEIRLDGRKLMIGDRLIQTLAFPEDRGVYQADTDYEKGDMVSFGGSGWICTRTTRDKPGTSDAWRLMIKKGRDGRDNEPRPPQGPVRR